MRTLAAKVIRDCPVTAVNKSLTVPGTVNEQHEKIEQVIDDCREVDAIVAGLGKVIGDAFKEVNRKGQAEGETIGLAKGA